MLRPSARASAIVVGAGLMGRWHAHAIRRSGSRLAGIVDCDSARANALANRHGTKSYPDLEPAIAEARPDLAHICTPLPSHVPLIRTALAAGCHVVAEKPLAPTAAETAELLALATSKQRLLIPVHQFAWQHGARQLFARLPALGPLLHVAGECASAGAGPDADADAIAADILPHFLDLTRRVLGESRTLAEHTWTAARPRGGEWRVLGTCGPVSVSYLISMAARPTRNLFQVLGERGSASLDLYHGFAVFEKPKVSRRAKLARPLSLACRTLLAASVNLARRALRDEPAYPGLIELVRRSHLAALGRGEIPVTSAAALDVARARELIVGLLREHLNVAC